MNCTITSSSGAPSVCEDGIAAAESGSTEKLREQEAVLLHLTDLLLTNHTLSEAERADALNTLTVNQLADLTITVGFYQLVCNFLNTFGVEPERAAESDVGQ